MAKLTLRKYPKKPKASASADTIKNYFARCKEIDKENAAKKREHSERESLARKLKNFRPGKSKVGSTKRRSTKKAAPKKGRKAARKRR